MADHRETLRMLIEEVFGKGRMDLFDQVIHEDYVDHTMMEGVPPNRDGFRGFVQTVHGAMSDINATLERTVISGDEVAWRWRMQGTHSGEFMGIPASGNRIDISGNDLGVMRDGKLVESWGEMDMLNLMTQIGAIPAPAT